MEDEQDRQHASADPVQAAMDKSTRAFEETRQMLLELHWKLDALMEHWGVPYPPADGGEG